MSTQPLLLYDPLRFLLIYLNHIRLLYRSYSLCFVTLLILTFIYIYVHFYVFIYYYYYHALGAMNISFYLVLYHRHYMLTIQLSHIILLDIYFITLFDDILMSCKCYFQALDVLEYNICFSQQKIRPHFSFNIFVYALSVRLPPIFILH